MKDGKYEVGDLVVRSHFGALSLHKVVRVTPKQAILDDNELSPTRLKIDKTSFSSPIGAGTWNSEYYSLATEKDLKAIDLRKKRTFIVNATNKYTEKMSTEKVEALYKFIKELVNETKP